MSNILDKHYFHGKFSLSRFNISSSAKSDFADEISTIPPWLIQIDSQLATLVPVTYLLRSVTFISFKN